MVYVFKTNITTAAEVQEMEFALNIQFPNDNWNFDLDDCDNIFRIESMFLDSTQIIHKLHTLKIECTELE